MFQHLAKTCAACRHTFSRFFEYRSVALFAATAIGLASLLVVSPVAQSANAAQPNVVLIMTDDQGYGDLACHGNEMIQTPSLDALAKQSVRMTNFHVDPTCSETRSALMTGRYSTRTGVWHTIMGRSILRRDEVTMADVFKAGGYQTGIFGKWHLGDNYPFRPQDRGFGEVLICGGGGVTQTPDFWGNDYFDDTYYHNGKPERQEGYCTDVFFRAGMRFIEANRDRPFFCYIPTNRAARAFQRGREIQPTICRSRSATDDGQLLRNDHQPSTKTWAAWSHISTNSAWPKTRFSSS